MQDVEFVCGVHPLPLEHALRTREHPMVMDDKVVCSSPMEVLYYGEKAQNLKWPLVCYNCGSGDDVTVPKTKEEWTQVYPQCAGCAADANITPDHSGKLKKCDAATSAQKRGAAQAELLANERAEKRQRAPDENSGEDGIVGVVGKKNQGGLKFIYWKSLVTGKEYPKNQCTWEKSRASWCVSSGLSSESAGPRLLQPSCTSTQLKQMSSGLSSSRAARRMLMSTLSLTFEFLQVVAVGGG